MLRACCHACALLAAVLAGLLYSGALLRAGAFQWVDSWDPSGRGLRWRGELPGIAPTPWAFAPERLPPLGGRLALVTGASGAGLGFWTAAHLLGANATVVACCRDAAACEAAKRALLALHPASGGAVVPVSLDLASLASVRRAAAKVADLATYFGGGLDMLARLASASPPHPPRAFAPSFPAAAAARARERA